MIIDTHTIIILCIISIYWFCPSIGDTTIIIIIIIIILASAPALLRPNTVSRELNFTDTERVINSIESNRRIIYNRVPLFGLVEIKFPSLECAT